MDMSMKYQSNIIQGQEAILGLMNGVNIATNLIKATYGGGAYNIIIEDRRQPFHQIANDAWTIIKDIKLQDPAERIGLEFIKEVCAKQDKLSGDSRKTTILLTSALLKAGYDSEVNKLQLKRDLDALIPVIEKAIDAQTVDITVNDVESVATTSSENPEIGKLLQEIYQKIGKDGIIYPEGSGTYETSYKFIDGVRFGMTGYLSPYMVHDEQAIKDKVTETKAVYEKPLILVTKKKITTEDDINPLLRQLIAEDKRDLVIFTADMDSNVASMLINLHKSKSFNIIVIKNASVWRDYVYEDFAKCTGATIIEDASGINSFSNMPLSVLGTCDKIIVDSEETILIGTKDIPAHIATLESKGDDDSKLRLSWLTNKSAILKLGANSETELSYKRLKCHDAIRSSELALKYGIVKGGGVCLLNAVKAMPNTHAGIIMGEVLQAPNRQIRENAGNPFVYDVGENIVDAAAVIKSAVRNSIGIASTILTTTALVYIPELTSAQSQQQYANF